MFTAALGLLIGAIAIQQFTHLPSLWWVLGVLPLAVIAWRWPAARLFLWIALGMAWTVWRADLTLGPNWPTALMKRDVVLTGYVSGIPQTTEHRVRFIFVVESARLGKNPFPEPPQRVRLNWYGKTQLLKPGERWRLRVRLKPRNGFMNPGGFDYESWLFRHGIGATGYVRMHGGERLPGLRLTPSVRLDRWREFLAQRISAVVPKASERGVLLALVLGIRAGIPQNRWQALLDTGTNHLIAISGLHIGLVAGLAFFLMRWLWASIPRLTLLFAAPRAAAVFGWSLAALYAALAGFSVPTQRALIMLLVGFGGLLLWRRAGPARSLAAALFAVLLFDPLVVLDAGFWLSFAAVAFILYAVTGREGTGWLHSWGRIQWALLLGLLPITVLLFQRTTPIAPLQTSWRCPGLACWWCPWRCSGPCCSCRGRQRGSFCSGVLLRR